MILADNLNKYPKLCALQVVILVPNKVVEKTATLQVLFKKGTKLYIEFFTK